MSIAKHHSLQKRIAINIVAATWTAFIMLAILGASWLIGKI